jgi:hypothetical protein
MSDNSRIPVYVALAEVAPLEGCHLDLGDCGGAFVRCYVAADTEAKAMKQIADFFQKNRFQLVDVEWCVDESAVQWENPNDATGAELIREARAASRVVLGEFHTWPPE